jgi:hypothetical protein
MNSFTMPAYFYFSRFTSHDNPHAIAPSMIRHRPCVILGEQEELLFQQDTRNPQREYGNLYLILFTCLKVITNK